MNNTSLQDLLRHQDSYILHKPFASSIAGTSTEPPPISPPPTPTIAFNVLKPKRKKLALSTTSSSTPIPPCTECGKRFSSWKALFGHMRCHPERQWRGINPPPNLRRGAQFTAEEYEVASSLILLANGPGRSKQQKKRLTISTDHDATSPEIVHNCSVCLKGFSSGQALGGHMRCHWDIMDDCPLNAVVVAAANAKDFVLDLNLPPVDQGCAVTIDEDTGGLDLRLKI